MNTMRLAAALGIVSIMAGATGFIACSSSDDSSSGGGGSKDSGQQNQNDSGNGNPGNGGDGGAGGNVDAATTSDPGKVSCVSQTCNSGGPEVCCVNDAGSGCKASADKCPSGSLQATCDEAADCPSSGICCGVLDTIGQKIEVDCSSASSCAQFQVCKTDAECKNGQGCKAQSCAGSVVHLCGNVQGCTPVQ